jgi:Lipoate-protein ligase B
MPEWIRSDHPVPYPEALAFMEHRVAEIAAGRAEEAIWLLEHPPLYTAGTSARAEDLITPNRFPVYEAGRGGQYTYHGPGQRIVYVMLDLNRRGKDVRCFVRHLESWVIRTLAEFNLRGEIRDGRVGVWVARRTSPAIRTARWPRTRSPRSGSSCAAGSAFTASRSTSSRIWNISPASCPAASAITGSPALSI